MQRSSSNHSPRTTIVCTKLTKAETALVKTRADDAGVKLSTFVRAALLRSRLKGTCVPRLNQEGWALLSNLDIEVRAALARPGGVDDISLAAFASDIAALRALLIGRAE